LSCEYLKLTNIGCNVGPFALESFNLAFTDVNLCLLVSNDSRVFL